MLNLLLIIFGKTLSKLVQLLNLGNGSTWPGHIALKINKQFIQDILAKSKITIILVAGTNGKTTTTSLIKSGLEAGGKTVIQNESGANLVNGIASTLLLKAQVNGKLPYDVALFEVDENALPLVLKQLTPNYLVLLNLFRDQLDRYGEVNTIVSHWQKAIQTLSDKTTLILNADDPQVAYLGLQEKKYFSSEHSESRSSKPISSRRARTIQYFGLQDAQFGKENLQHAADSVYCPQCGEKLIFDAIAFSHLGRWHCKSCSLKRPSVEKDTFFIYPLSGLYNKYNTLAAATTLKQIGISDNQIEEAFLDFKPAFGRQETIRYKNKNVQIFLSKNPTSFNQSYQTIQELHGKTLLLVLNDRIPDGRDVSWIWDIDLLNIQDFKQVLIAGDRVYDMALRIKYELGIRNYELGVQTYENLAEAIEAGIKSIRENETLFIVPTYSAMLEVRKIITGKKIL